MKKVFGKPLRFPKSPLSFVKKLRHAVLAESNQMSSSKIWNEIIDSCFRKANRFKRQVKRFLWMPSDWNLARFSKIYRTNISSETDFKENHSKLLT